MRLIGGFHFERLFLLTRSLTAALKPTLMAPDAKRNSATTFQLVGGARLMGQLFLASLAYLFAPVSFAVECSSFYYTALRQIRYNYYMSYFVFRAHLTVLWL